MYRFWDSVIGPLLDQVAPDLIVEVGSDQGFNTRNLVDFCRRQDAVLHVIDPLPKYDVDEWLQEYSPNMVFHLSTSIEVLGSIDQPDVVLIDGDHNWYTVINELRLLQKTAGDRAFPLVLFHDIGWPYGRRDLYYEPDRIPSPDRHPHRKEGLRPERRDLDPDGGLNTHLFNAVHEGGPRNGVLTAVEDFIEESGLDLKLAIVPGINSLGILYPAEFESRYPGASELIGELGESRPLREVLERVERMRVEAQIESADTRRSRDEFRRSLADQSREAANLRKERDSLTSRLNQMTGQRDRVSVERERLRGDVRALTMDLDKAKNQLEQLEDLQRTTKGELASAQRQLSSAEKKLIAAERKYERLSSRRLVRLALSAARFASPLMRSIRRLRRGIPGETSSAGPTVALNQAAQDRLAKSIAMARPGSGATEGPLVSIIVLTRDGAHHLGRLLPALDQTTTYRSFEVIVVDNASSDETPALLQLERGYPLRVIRNERNLSFSEGNNQATAQADGELLLFLNNDIVPINPGWLGALVEAVGSSEETVAAGAELVYPVRGVADKDLTVQHVGIGFDIRHGAAHPVNVHWPDPLDERIEATRVVPAATAAALMVTTEAFRAAGGFDEGYVYGSEDVDLCLKLNEHGNIVVTGQAVMFHYESATQSRVAEGLTRMNRLRNHQRFTEQWGPRLSRTVLSERLSGSDRYRLPRKRRVAITLTHDDETRGWGDFYTAHGLGDAFAAEGWDVVYAHKWKDEWYDVGDDVDLVISLLDAYDVRRAPDGAVTIAWVRNWVDRWLEQPFFESYDLAVTSSQTASEIIAERSRFVPAVIPMATNTEEFHPGEPNPTFRADYVFTGNHWGERRAIVDVLDVQPDEEFLCFGKGWDRDPRMMRYWRGHLEHEMLPEVYRSAKIVLDDTAAPTRPYAFLNGRVFDALAAGALVITDNVKGSEELFDGRLPTYSGGEELRSLLDHYLASDDERRTLVDDLRSRVVESHDYRLRPQQFVDLARDHVAQARAAIKIAVPDVEVREAWGDTHFASGLANALTRAGLPTEVHILPEWDLASSQDVDVVIHLRGLSNYVPKPSHVNVLWIISHPDQVTLRECEKYDLVLVASRSHAELLGTQLEVPVVFLPQATDQRRFRPVASQSELVTDVLFLGNSRGQMRPAVDWAIRQDLPLTVYGTKWEERIPNKYLAGEHFPNEDLASLYASAKVVLNDHWTDMKDRGFVSNRVFDALASGAVVVSDDAVGLGELFDDIVPTFSSPEELSTVVTRLLADPEERRLRAARGLELVLGEHTFAHRAEAMIGMIQPLLEGRAKDMEGRVFEFANAPSRPPP